MIRAKTVKAPHHIYPVDEWRIVEKQFYPRFLPQTETIFSVANGFLGLRGGFEEGSPGFQSGTFINGFYESWPIPYGESAYGFARTGQTMLNVTDCKIIKLYVDDEPFYLPTANLLRFERSLQMKEGTLDRELLWETPSGKFVLLESRRLVSFKYRHLAAIAYRITILNDEAPVVISSELAGNQPNQSAVEDPRQAKGFAGSVLRPQQHYARDQRVVLSHRTASSALTIACGADHVLESEAPAKCRVEVSEDAAQVVYSIDAQPGVPIQLFKFVSYHTSRSADAEELCRRAERTLDSARGHGFEKILEGQKDYLADFWERSDVLIEGSPDRDDVLAGEIRQALRWNLFQIIQAAGRAEGTGIPAKGLTGQTYEGHYFWDTEIYVMPFLIYTAPRIARNLLRYRHSMLDKARQRAREVNQKGALFPWRTINGEEASAYYAAGTAQYHINADIVFAVRKYVEATGDRSFLYNEGAEILVETARLWLDLGFYSRNKEGKFCIHGVTGPDEYNAVVDNNTYTNLMARENLWYAAQTVEFMRDHNPPLYDALVDKTRLDPAEIAEWRQAADNMYLAYDEETGVFPQDDQFLDKKEWDFANTPRDRYPLLLHYHPLVIYRHKVIKQADVVLALFLLGDEFSLEAKKRNFDFYDPLTTGDSSLSACIQSIVATEVGDEEKANSYGFSAVLMDLGDVGGNVREGVHIASMGGTWMVAVYGFAGMRDYNGELSFRPRLPKSIRRLRFPLILREQRLVVEMRHEGATYELIEGAGLTICHEGEPLRLEKGHPETRPVTAGPGSRPTAGAGEGGGA
ncbi:MAG: glycoside hydrolase family 65 protein [Deltaproteobacteria bacterium]|nr:glycoside hydrolase family 65 protein [Deltaproteobacteria bacterium]